MLPLSVHCYPFLHAPSSYISLFSIPSANQCGSFRAAAPEEGAKRKRERKRDIGTLEKKESKREGGRARARPQRADGGLRTLHFQILEQQMQS
jgi:hypothetical protein